MSEFFLFTSGFVVIHWKEFVKYFVIYLKICTYTVDVHCVCANLFREEDIVYFKELAKNKALTKGQGYGKGK